MKKQPQSSAGARKATGTEKRRVMTKRSSGAASNRTLRQLDVLIRDQAWDTVRSVLVEPKSKGRSSKTAAERAVRRRRSSSSLRRCSASYLSLAVSSDAPADVVSALLRLDPSAASREDRFGRIPLHVACMHGAAVKVVRELLLADPSEEEDGRAGGGSSEKESLVAAAAAAAATVVRPDDNGGTTTMAAVPLALRPDSDGRVPLHYAAEYAAGSYGETLDAVAVLGAACPEAAFAKDRWDETPACVAEAMEEAAKLDGDHDMAEAAREVGRSLRRHSSMMRWRSRRSAHAWTRGSAMLRKSAGEDMVLVESLAAEAGNKVENGTTATQRKHRVDVRGLGRDEICEVEPDTRPSKCDILIADSTAEPVFVQSPTEACPEPRRRLFRRKQRKVHGII